MGGCYESSFSYSGSRCSEPSKPKWETSLEDGLKDFFKNKNPADLVKAYAAFFESNDGGFIKKVIEHQKHAEALKEFPEIEYEVKLNVVPVQSKKSGQEPSIEQYLDAFEFPAVQRARFLKDPINTNAEGTNHFFGDGVNERLVVIEKGGKLYLKEKSQPLPLETGVEYEDIVMKRTERRYGATMDAILQKVSEVNAAGGTYVGAIRKEKGDAFVLDAIDGRIFSFTITRASLKLPGGVTKVQRQLELEYAGYVPGFSGFVKDDETQIVADMVDLAKHVVFLSNGVPVANGWQMQIGLTTERKYDFVRGDSSAGASGNDKVKLLTADLLRDRVPEKKKAKEGVK